MFILNETGEKNGMEIYPSHNCCFSYIIDTENIIKRNKKINNHQQKKSEERREKEEYRSAMSATIYEVSSLSIQHSFRIFFSYPLAHMSSEQISFFFLSPIVTHVSFSIFSRFSFVFFFCVFSLSFSLFLQSLLTHVSRPTKNTLNKLGVFTVSSFHAFICARSPSLLNNLLAGRGATKRRPPLLSRSNSGSSRRSMQVIYFNVFTFLFT